ncbi:brain-specific angiogenesis inhibitor 1-associated protein 2-like protein 2 isoform X2 [Rhinatrema bivittatum]|uniref:brain-specific angiogenesis inhibitor 1-associated protein 2-like protein 2 isoform X2 n=1 Tax=Rhinatrema bivittatum TaxID=194408 RepID=UPI00112790F3|nr:brain-specific angiogenesis inhibitor 1-associated protein 2-like protein 2 isoform X2 [Rhinatrema bivittatum]
MAHQMDQFYSSTINIYKNILDQFNPALENLVYLGNNYLQALNALSKAAEVYFNAIKKIGEQALKSATSQSLGQILVQMADSQRHLNSGVERVDSHKRYEMEYRHRTANLDKCMAEVWRMERMRDKNLREMKENVNSLHSDMQAFVSQSHQAAELEEKRRYRFLAEKQWVLSNTFFQFYSRACGILQNRVSLWKEQVDASRDHPSGHSQMYSTSQGQGYSSNRQVPSHLDTSQRSLGDFGSAMSRSSNSILQAVEREQAEMRTPLQSDMGRRPIQRSPSSGSLLSGQRSRSSSFGDVASIAGSVKVQAIVSHATSGNQTMLRFGKGDVITVLVPEARNGWLYGRLEGLNETGWFPEAYVKSLEDERDAEEQSVRSFALRSTHSTGDLLDRSDDLEDVYQTSAPIFPSDRMPSRTVPSVNNRRSSVTSTASQAAGTRAQKSTHPPELFPRGTNPFATVKLRPTVTNDRSAPLIR